MSPREHGFFWRGCAAREHAVIAERGWTALDPPVALRLHPQGFERGV
jgi:hypothetical protein